jgi:hypothetical protein
LRYPDRELQQGPWRCTPLQGENSMKTLKKATNLIGLTTLLVLGHDG